MSLPRPVLATETIQLGGEPVEIRSLTMAQSIRLETLAEDKSAAATFMVACGTGVSEQEAADWLDSVPVDLASDLIVAIVKLSGLEESVTVEGPSGPKASRGRKLTSVS